MASYQKIAPFGPGPSVNVAVTTTTANVKVEDSELYHSMIVYNGGGSDVYVELGESSDVVAVVNKAVSVTIVMDGTGYAEDDELTVVGGTGTATTIIVDTVDGSGVILTAHLGDAGDYTVKPSNPVSVTGGAGTTATFLLRYNGSMPLKAGTSRLLIASPYVAARTAASTSTLYVTAGDSGSGLAA